MGLGINRGKMQVHKIYIYISYTTADIFLLAPEGKRREPEGLRSFERKWSVTVGQRKEGSDRLDLCVVFSNADVSHC